MGEIFFCHASGLAGRVSVSRVPVAGQAVKAMVGADGTIHLLLDSTQGPRYVKSQDSGRTFSEPMAIVDAASQKPGLKFDAADLAIGKGGRLHVAMDNNALELELPKED